MHKEFKDIPEPHNVIKLIDSWMENSNQNPENHTKISKSLRIVLREQKRLLFKKI